MAETAAAGTSRAKKNRPKRSEEEGIPDPKWESCVDSLNMLEAADKAARLKCRSVQAGIELVCCCRCKLESKFESGDKRPLGDTPSAQKPEPAKKHGRDEESSDSEDEGTMEQTTEHSQNVQQMLQELNRVNAGHRSQEHTTTEEEGDSAETLEPWPMAVFKAHDDWNKSKMTPVQWAEHAGEWYRTAVGFNGLTDGLSIRGTMFDGGELYNKSDVMAVSKQTKAIFDGAERWFKDFKDQLLEIECMAAEHGPGNIPTELLHDHARGKLWQVPTQDGVSSMHFLLQGARPDIQDGTIYFEFRLFEPGPLQGMPPANQEVEIRNLLISNIQYGDWIMGNVLIIPDMALADSKPRMFRKDPLGTPFLVLARNKTAARAVVKELANWRREGLDVQIHGKTGTIVPLLRLSCPIYAGHMGLKLKFITGTPRNVRWKKEYNRKKRWAR